MMPAGLMTVAAVAVSMLCVDDSSPFGSALVIAFVVIVLLGALAFVVFCVASMTWGAWQVIEAVWADLRPRTPPERRGFEVLQRRH